MPVISMFYGVIVMMYYFDNRRLARTACSHQIRRSESHDFDYPIFRELKDVNRFKNIKIVFGTVQWENGQDISPETLYLEGKEIKQTVKV